jgi:hypothetical protein
MKTIPAPMAAIGGNVIAVTLRPWPLALHLALHWAVLLPATRDARSRATLQREPRPPPLSRSRILSRPCCVSIVGSPL